MDENSVIIDEFTDVVRWIQKEIRKERLSTPDDRSVYFEYQKLNSSPSEEDQRRAINFLEKEKKLYAILSNQNINIMLLVLIKNDLLPEAHDFSINFYPVITFSK